MVDDLLIIILFLQGSLLALVNTCSFLSCLFLVNNTPLSTVPSKFYEWENTDTRDGLPIKKSKIWGSQQEVVQSL